MEYELLEKMKPVTISKCLWCNSVKAGISAHSIQKAKYLQAIAEDGHIIAPNMKFGILPKFSFEKIGINKFSTFFGFCQSHDTQVFKPIEKFPFQNTPEQVFLYAFRALSREYHLKKQNVQQAKKISKTIPSEEASHWHKIETVSVKELKKIFYKMKTEIMSKDFSSLETFYVPLDYAYPIVVNGSYIPYNGVIEETLISTEDRKKITNREIPAPSVYLNVFPEDNKTHILFSMRKNEPQYLIDYFRDKINIKNLELLVHLSNIIIRQIENVGFSPSYFERNFSEDDKKTLKTSFLSNAILVDNGDAPNINLFIKT